MTIRQARAEDHADVAAFTEDTWPERDVGDYIPDVFEEWVRTDGPDQHTAVVEHEGSVVACCQARLLGSEGWLQGMRVDHDHRGAGHGRRLTEYLLDWLAADAAVARNLVFDWNPGGMGESRTVGLEPVAGCRFVRVDARETDPDFQVVQGVDTPWQYWTASEARTALSGLGLDPDEPWALTELTRERVADGTGLALVADGVRATAVGLGTRDPDHREGVVADYAGVAFEDGAAEALFDAVRADAAEAGADEARVLLPATARHVSGAALARAALGEGAYAFGIDLADW